MPWRWKEEKRAKRHQVNNDSIHDADVRPLVDRPHAVSMNSEPGTPLLAGFMKVGTGDWGEDPGGLVLFALEDSIKPG
jgi:hypothetical protein